MRLKKKNIKKNSTILPVTCFQIPQSFYSNCDSRLGRPPRVFRGRPGQAIKTCPSRPRQRHAFIQTNECRRCVRCLIHQHLIHRHAPPIFVAPPTPAHTLTQSVTHTRARTHKAVEQEAREKKRDETKTRSNSAPRISRTKHLADYTTTQLGGHNGAPFPGGGGVRAPKRLHRAQSQQAEQQGPALPLFHTG